MAAKDESLKHQTVHSGHIDGTEVEEELPTDLQKGTDRDDLDMQRIGKRQQLSVS